MRELRKKLQQIHKKSYKAYKDLTGKTYRFDSFDLTFDHIQGDPFAAPSKITVTVPVKQSRFPAELFDNRIKSIAFRDALSRGVAGNIRSVASGNRGSGGSGKFVINHGTQKILNRNSVVMRDGGFVVRLLAGMPAYGRRIAGDQAEEMFFGELPRIIDRSLFWKNVDQSVFKRFVDLIQKQETIRAGLSERGLIGFVADGAILPRKSGIDDTPLKDAVHFESPETMRVTFRFDDGTEITGMGMKKGITIITGGGFHGKSTLLNGIQAGIYNHIPGYGREFVITVRGLAKIRAEDGRNIEKVDISSFINNLPGGVTTERFSSPNASGSTSQAANIMEALEIGTELLIMDEDTCATNFLIRDKRMQELIPAEKEPITPYIDVARPLFDQRGVSTVFVVGGSGDYIDVADTVILLDHYRTKDVTERAREVAKQFPFAHIDRFSGDVQVTERSPIASSIDPSKGKRDANIKTREQKIVFGRNDIDLSQWEHIVDRTQLDTIGDILLYGLRTGLFKEGLPIKRFLELVLQDIETNGLDCIFERNSRSWNYYCEVRSLDVASALNRLRSLRIN